MFIGHVCPPHSTYTAPTLRSGSVNADMLSSFSRVGLHQKKNETTTNNARGRCQGVDRRNARTATLTGHRSRVSSAAVVTTATTTIASASASAAAAGATATHTTEPFSCWFEPKQNATTTDAHSHFQAVDQTHAQRCLPCPSLVFGWCPYYRYYYYCFCFCFCCFFFCCRCCCCFCCYGYTERVPTIFFFFEKRA